MTVARVSSVKLNLVAEAEKAVRQVKKEVVSSNDIISRAELPFEIPAQYSSYYSKWGFRFIRFIQHCFLAERAQTACGFAANQQFEQLKFPTTAACIAETRFGRGECRVVTQLASMLLAHLPLPPCQFALTSDEDSGSPFENPSLYGHMFLILGISHEDLDKTTDEVGSNELIKIFDRLKQTHSQAVIADPFLGCVSRIGDYQQRAKPLLDYNKAFGTHYVCILGECPWLQADVATMKKEGESLYNLAKSNFLGNVSNRKEAIVQEERQKFVAEKVHKDILPASLAAAKALYPAVTWAGKFDSATVEWTVAAQVSKTQAGLIIGMLQRLSFKVLLGKVEKSKTDVMVTLQNPNSRELCTLAAAQALYPRHLTDLINAFAAD